MLAARQHHSKHEIGNQSGIVTYWFDRVNGSYTVPRYHGWAGDVETKNN